MNWLMLKPMRKSKHEHCQRSAELFKQTFSRRIKPKTPASSRPRLHSNSWAMFSNTTSTTTYATTTPFPSADITSQKQVQTQLHNSHSHSQTALPTSNIIEAGAWILTNSHRTSPSSSVMGWILSTPSLAELHGASGLLPCVTCTERMNALRN